MSIKCFAVDVDGTITENGGKLDLQAVQVLRQLEESGYKVILASGRSHYELYPLASFLGITKMAVAENGGVIVYSPQDLVINHDKTECLNAYEHLVKEINNVNLRNVFPRLTEVVVERTFDIEHGKEIIKENKLEVTLTDSGYGYHICGKNVNKANGFEEILKKLKLTWKETIAIGDSETDIELFERSSYSVSMGQSPNHVKDKSNYSTKNKMGKGFIESVEHIREKFL